MWTMRYSKNVGRKRITRLALIVGGILLIPLVLTLLNPNAEIYGGGGGGWDWMPGDFLVMGALLFATGLAIEYARNKLANPVYRAIAIIAIILALLAIWVELAVDGVSQALQILF